MKFHIALVAVLAAAAWLITLANATTPGDPVKWPWKEPGGLPCMTTRLVGLFDELVYHTQFFVEVFPCLIFEC